jgi:hypothetical protein
MSDDDRVKDEAAAAILRALSNVSERMTLETGVRSCWACRKAHGTTAGCAVCAASRSAVWQARETTASHAVDSLTEEQRVALFAKYCHGCGRKDPACRCEDDT